MDIKELHQLYLQSSGVNTDTRTLKKNQLYFALKGDNFDGNAFAKKAIKAGAIKAVIDSKDYHNKNCVLVENTLTTLQKLANYHRKYLNLPIIAITGSNGKTTTKKLVLEVLSQKFKVAGTKGNLNNHIGVPLTLLSFDRSTEIGIIEMGANHQKEIEALCKIAEPNYGYITNFGKAHLEGFGGIEGVIKGKSELYEFLIKANRKIFINNDDDIQINKTLDAKTYSIGQSKLSHCVVSLLEAKPYVKIEVDGVKIESKLIGEYNFKNISAAVGIGKYFSVPLKNIQIAIENFQPEAMRSELIKRENYQIILDAYNANPTSMKLALENLCRLDSKKKIAILGDMFEIGETSLKEHQQLLAYAKSLQLNDILLLGEEFKKASVEFESISHFDSVENLIKHLKKSNLTNSSILIKGSRGMKLEVIINEI
ncbi:UDP-N-acetylmuramoyl-tripeptide--D-alanyl-D-alanine ligase [Psychroflexus sp. ALD_RP9]|uniref:UDP-N-acetylmuramoyl-tripeptide--D-alanyl-D- alanine ligase n=1 Tax=Psychroflexus sp. ALD_RP9 TaxID=2777186 RepID=UPI001A8E4407|nr:UDP-N-acetylmuramoyl-tripeptide--D-alanyl-D-alanine ligase [Psychroflexus sp. ALD_RP9]QSS96357.1 UDP-N-acetylmuramoyl-tripeptide--D-alanyl-D-alanine ligase [Psychroflexus sp. ALD_RP9]